MWVMSEGDETSEGFRPTEQEETFWMVEEDEDEKPVFALRRLDAKRTSRSAKARAKGVRKGGCFSPNKALWPTPDSSYFGKREAKWKGGKGKGRGREGQFVF